MSTMYLLVIVRHLKNMLLDLNKAWNSHVMISDKRGNMVFVEHYYLPPTLARLRTFIQTCSCWNERTNDEQPLRIRALEAGFACEADIVPSGFPSSGTSSLLSHLPHPHSHIIYSWPPSKIYYCLPEWSPAYICELTQSYSVHFSHHSLPFWIIKAASLLGHLRTMGRVLSNPFDSYRLQHAHPENSWHLSLWWTFYLLKGPCPYLY